MTRYVRNLGGIVHLPPGYAYDYKKRMKKKEQYFLDVQSSRQKARNNARQPGTAELRRKPILSVLDATLGCYQLDCPQTEIACWNSIRLCKVNQLEPFLVRFIWKNVSALGLLHMVSWGCCDNTLLMCKTCLHAVYHQSKRIKTLYFVLLGKWQLKKA